ncbi:MAG: hypothetical protein ACRCXT_02990 [Paraclostridium sp.]
MKNTTNEVEIHGLIESLRHEPDNMTITEVVTSTSFLHIMSYIWIPFIIILLIYRYICKK